MHYDISTIHLTVTCAMLTKLKQKFTKFYIDNPEMELIYFHKRDQMKTTLEIKYGRSLS